jgi:hypothetical protein
VNAGEDYILGKLSDADKDALIARLWRDLQDERARSQELERRLALRNDDRAQDSGQLLKKLQQAGARKRSPRQSVVAPGLSLSRALDFVSARVLIAIAVLIALVFALDLAVGRYQQYRQDQRRMAELRLQHAAYEGHVYRSDKCRVRAGSEILPGYDEDHQR